MSHPSSAAAAPALGSHGPSTQQISSASGASRPGVGQVKQDLLRFGPDRPIPAMALDEAFTYCRDLANRHYENFTVLTHLVPARIRPHFCSIYAYCRWSDDLADEMGSPERSTALLEWWRGELDACFQGRANHPVFVALRQTINEYGLESTPFNDLLSAFVQDQTQHRYESDSELRNYCSRSANPVGRMVLQLARTATPPCAAWSDSICTGLQIANFCQDIAVDARRGRVYWPESRLQAIGVNPHELSRPTATEAACRGVMDWANEARKLLVAGLPLVQHGPVWLARSVQLFVRGGLGLAREVDRLQGDVWTHNVMVSRPQKLQWIVRALLFPRSVALARIDQPRTDT
ncbi:MAG: squalene synthase HpnC [Pirellula sp.]|nr:squalene synthase HpnC [Pirellula sp.]